jgi:hypothetical protein
MFTNLFISLNVRTMTAEVLTVKPEGVPTITVHPVKEVMIQIGRAAADLSTGKTRTTIVPQYGAIITRDGEDYRTLVRLNGGKHYEVFSMYPRRNGDKTPIINPQTGEIVYSLSVHPRMKDLRFYMGACKIDPRFAVTKHVAMAAWAAGIVLEVDMSGANAGTPMNIPLWLRKGYKAELEYIAKNTVDAAPAEPEETQEMPQVVDIPQPQEEPAPAQHTPKLDVNMEMGVRTTELNAVRLLLTTEDPDTLPAWAKARIKHAESKGRMPQLIGFVAQELAIMEVEL